MNNNSRQVVSATCKNIYDRNHFFHFTSKIISQLVSSRLKKPIICTLSNPLDLNIKFPNWYSVENEIKTEPRDYKFVAFPVCFWFTRNDFYYDVSLTILLKEDNCYNRMFYGGNLLYDLFLALDDLFIVRDYNTAKKLAKTIFNLFYEYATSKKTLKVAKRAIDNDEVKAQIEFKNPYTVRTDLFQDVCLNIHITNEFIKLSDKKSGMWASFKNSTTKKNITHISQLLFKILKQNTSLAFCHYYSPPKITRNKCTTTIYFKNFKITVPSQVNEIIEDTTLFIRDHLMKYFKSAEIEEANIIRKSFKDSIFRFTIKVNKDASPRKFTFHVPLCKILYEGKDFLSKNQKYIYSTLADIINIYATFLELFSNKFYLEKKCAIYDFFAVFE